jgi:xanthine dehydrogenase accessory factor
MVTALDWSNGPRKIVTSAQAPAGTDRELQALAKSLDAFATEPLFSDGFLTEPIVGRPRLVVFGAGHVGARIAEVASIAGWHVTVVDDRADFADPTRLPFADRVVTCEFHDVMASARFDADTYVVIATRGHQHDAVIASQVVPKPLRYVGMLGSRRKAALTSKQLREWNVTDASIAQIHAPVGVSIGADTPEEIAVSVVAEMIAVRRSSSSRRGGIDPILAANAAGANEMGDPGAIMESR